MKTIWKYPLPIQDEAVIEMPAWSQVLHVGLDPEKQPCLWALVDPDERRIKYEFYVFGTGNKIKDGFTASRHVGSFTDGPFMWHVFQ